MMPEVKTFRIRLTMESDWHVGSGMGRPGSVDRLVARDFDGLPFVPAKTLHGIWRDACERLCRSLDDGQSNGWARLVDLIFGSQPALGQADPTGRHSDPARMPMGSALKIRPARIPGPLRQLLSRRRAAELRHAMTIVKPGVQIDRKTGAAKADFLRFEEVARKKTILESDCEIEVEKGIEKAAQSLLAASAFLVERLGGKRRRGNGKCRLEILNIGAGFGIGREEASRWLGENKKAPDWKEKCPDRPAVSPGSLEPGKTWIRLPIRLELLGPLSVSYRVTGNVVETLRFVPGTLLLPHLTRCFGKLAPWFASGNAMVLPAYPELDGQRGLPVPMALFAPKDSGNSPTGSGTDAKVLNRLLDPLPEGGTQYKQLREGFVPDSPSRVHTTRIGIHTHNTVDDPVQRPTENVGGVYTYEAITPIDGGKPVILLSEIRLKMNMDQATALLGPQWHEKIQGAVSIGRSKKDDYGQVNLMVGKPEEMATSPKEPFTGDTLIVWLVSDMLLRDSHLRYSPTAEVLACELSKKLGTALALRQSGTGIPGEMVRVRRLDTWHVGWGLPRPSLVALQGGSCIAFQLKERPGDLAEKLAELEKAGVGERTAEGYGQLRFNDPMVSQKPKADHTVSAQIPAEDSDEGLPKTDPAYQFACLLEKEAWTRKIRQKCLEIANHPNKREEYLGWRAQGGQGKPPMSQLGALRGQVARMGSPEAELQIISWIDHLNKNKRRRSIWPEISLEKTKTMFVNRANIWKIIDPNSWPTLTANGSDRLKQDLWPLAVRAFLDSCIRAHKRELELQQRSEVANGA